MSSTHAAKLIRLTIWNRGSIPVLSLLMALALAGCGGGSGASVKRSTYLPRSTLGTISLDSAAFRSGGPISKRYTCDGAGLSPPLRWHNAPAGTAELLLLAIDLNGGRGDAVQWAVGGLAPNLHGIATGRLPATAVLGRDSAGKSGKSGWGGICGLRGRVHHVAFLLYALSRRMGLKAGFDPAIVRSALKSATLARGLTVATYRRR
jgi:phosphatidylethanolamine-binding protein (PEBP) family uncharacterized protein